MIIQEVGGLEGLEETLDEIASENLVELEQVYERFGQEVVHRVRSYMRGTRPSVRLPARLGGGWTGPRQVHPGGWSDVTHLLEQSYRHEVIRTATEVVLGIINDDPEGYGEELERRHGLWVVHGLDDPGGLIDQVIMVIIAQYPDWQAVA